MRLLLVGHGRMGKLVEALAAEYDASIAGVVTARHADRTLRDVDFGPVDVAIDFTLADAVPGNLPLLAARGINVVIGTTGWSAHEAELREVVREPALACSRRPTSRSA